MKIKDLIFLPVIENLREWWLNQKIERERKRILRIQQMEIRTRPFTAHENEEEMKKFMMKGTYKDSDGKEKKIEKLSRDMSSYYSKE